MEKLKILENSIDLLVETGKKLKDRHDDALIDRDAARKKLYDANDTIKRLSQSLTSEDKDISTDVIERKKEEIINRITSIIERLDKLQ